MMILTTAVVVIAVTATAGSHHDGFLCWFTEVWLTERALHERGVS